MLNVCSYLTKEQPHTSPLDKINTDMRHLTTGIRSDKCVFRRFRSCANVIECTYTNLDSTAYCTPSLYSIAYCTPSLYSIAYCTPSLYSVAYYAPRLQNCTACYSTECCRQL